MFFFLIFVFLFVIFFIALKNFLSKKFIVDLFKYGGVCVYGMRGRGKDVLFNWVIKKRAKPYISNVDYGGNYNEFKPSEQFNLGGNTCHNFIIDEIKPYEYPYIDGVDYYISDVGVYFPCQENNTLNKLYPSFPLFQALIRHLGDASLHYNVQSLNRPWDKLREQMDTYILCRKCKFLFGKFVTLKLTVYDRYQSAYDKVKPMKKRFGKQARLEYDKFTASHGDIRNVTIRFIHRNTYDTRRFKTILKGGN